MAIRRGSKELLPYLGGYAPVNIYKGVNKLAGWKWQSESGKVLQFQNGYKDTVSVEVDGFSEQEVAEGNPNLLKDSHIEFTGGSYMVKEYMPFLPLVEGADYTITVCVTPGLNTNLLRPYLSQGYRNFVELNVVNSVKQIVSASFKAIYSPGKTPEDDMKNAKVQIYRLPNNETTSGTKTTIHWVKIEKGFTATPIPTPSPDYPSEIKSLDNNFDIVNNEIATNIQLSEPLRSVGGVKDRLFLDTDGLWKVEQNVGEYIFNGTQPFEFSTVNKRIAINYFQENDPKKVYTYKTNQFKYFKNGEVITLTEYVVNQGNSGYNRFWAYINPDRLMTPDKEGVSKWFRDKPLIVLYDKHEPTIEVLPESEQIKLNNIPSFLGENHIYAVANLEPNLRGKMKVRDI